MVTAGVDAASNASRAFDRILDSKARVPGLEAFLEKVISNMPALAVTCSDDLTGPRVRWNLIAQAPDRTSKFRSPFPDYSDDSTQSS